MAEKSESIERVKGYKDSLINGEGKDLTVKVNVGVSDALKGLKAVQREAKRTARLLKEVENRQDIKDLSDDEILDELRSRGWDVEDTTFHVGDLVDPPFRQVQLNINNKKTGG